MSFSFPQCSKYPKCESHHKGQDRKVQSVFMTTHTSPDSQSIVDLSATPVGVVHGWTAIVQTAWCTEDVGMAAIDFATPRASL